MTFNREVISGLLHPPLTEMNVLSKDAVDRIKFISSKFSAPMGAYSDSKGHSYVREKVADFIRKRDGDQFHVDANNIYLTNGASEGVKLSFKLLIRDSKDGIMVPIPQYPLYSALLTLEGGTMVKYFLDENQNWGINTRDIYERIKTAKDLGINLRAIVVINPGNPTGNVLSREDIEDIFKVAYEENLVVLADEVYQNNIYDEEKRPFISFRRVLHEMGEPYRDDIELVSMHSVSKGLMGECGLRGGYMEAHNFDLFTQDILFKLKSIDLCSNSVGQIATTLMVDPPREGRESPECLELFKREQS
mmetsp:Transcript_14532/g.24803  ORF Transcript_14532/g.24803 Transcript_14532/m.24803 type:complete len:305 (+) Transcript_14532:269-1183(+)